jgi:hypothetical protein
MIVNDVSQGGILLVNHGSLAHVESHVYVMIRSKCGDLAVCLPFVSIACCVIVTTSYRIRNMECVARHLRQVSMSQN